MNITATQKLGIAISLIVVGFMLSIYGAVVLEFVFLVTKNLSATLSVGAFELCVIILLLYKFNNTMKSDYKKMNIKC